MGIGQIVAMDLAPDSSAIHCRFLMLIKTIETGIINCFSSMHKILLERNSLKTRRNLLKFDYFIDISLIFKRILLIGIYIYCHVLH